MWDLDDNYFIVVVFKSELLDDEAIIVCTCLSFCNFKSIHKFFKKPNHSNKLLTLSLLISYATRFLYLIASLPPSLYFSLSILLLMSYFSLLLSSLSALITFTLPSVLSLTLPLPSFSPLSLHLPLPLLIPSLSILSVNISLIHAQTNSARLKSLIRFRDLVL